MAADLARPLRSPPTSATSQWLALCEDTFRYDPLVTEHLPSASEATSGELFTRLRRGSARLRYRTEHGKRLHCGAPS